MRISSPSGTVVLLIRKWHSWRESKGEENVFCDRNACMKENENKRREVKEDVRMYTQYEGS